jgi:SAM-dependent methyltransferase
MIKDVIGRRRMVRAWARHDAATYHALRDTLQRQQIDLGHARVLDLGCGANAPMTLALHSAGVRVVGIDHVIGHRWGLGFKVDRYAAYRAEAGALRTFRKFAGELVFDRVYYKTLAETLGLLLHDDGVDLRSMPADRLDFPDATFDVIHSNATWEHLHDVRAVNAEVSRVLRPGGVAYIEIHLFPSLSGGHDLPWIVPGTIDLGSITPWAHLRDPQWRPPSVPLNRLRERDYRALFAGTPGLTVAEWQTEFTEGSEWLTDSIMKDLADYSRDELTKRSIIVVMRKESGH